MPKESSPTTDPHGGRAPIENNQLDQPLIVLIKKLDHFGDLALPSYATPQSSGIDLRAAVDMQLQPMQRCSVPTGLQFAIPVGYEGQVRPRSGLALKHGLTVLNTPGTIDADYRGEVRIILINLSDCVFSLTRGMRIAQLVFAPVVRAKLEITDCLPDSHRGEGGFGSTGI